MTKLIPQTKKMERNSDSLRLGIDNYCYLAFGVSQWQGHVALEAAPWANTQG